MAGLHDLRQAIDTDPAERERFFSYLYDRGQFRGMTDAEARTLFNYQIDNEPVVAQTLMNFYLNTYNLNLQGGAPAQPANPQAQSPMRSAVTKGVGVAAAGLLALIVSPSIDSEQARTLCQLVGATALLGGPVAIGIKYFTR